MAKMIYIMDCEYCYNDIFIPNYKVMKLYSYLKQKGDNPYIIHDVAELKKPYDVLYIIKEYEDTQFPPVFALDDKRTITMGAALKGENSFQHFPPQIAAVRPAYNLYKKEHGFENSEFLLHSIHGKLLPKIQEVDRYESENCVICDDDLWSLPEDTLLQILIALQSRDKVFFLNYVILDRLIASPTLAKEFEKIKLYKRRRLKVKLLQQTYENCVAAVDIMKRIKKNNKRAIQRFDILILIKNHWGDPSLTMVDFARCLKIGSYVRANKFAIRFIYPRKRFASPYWMYFEFFKQWGSIPGKSFTAAFLRGQSEYYNVPYYELLNNKKYWGNNKVNQSVALIANYPELMKEYAFNSSSGIDDDYAHIDFNYIEENGKQRFLT